MLNTSSVGEHSSFLIASSTESPFENLNSSSALLLSGVLPGIDEQLPQMSSFSSPSSNEIAPLVASDLGSVLGSAYNIGILNHPLTYTDFVGYSDTSDLYRFSVSSQSSFNLSLNGLSVDTYVELLDSNGERIATSNNSGTTGEWLDGHLAAGTYYVGVNQYGGNTDYRLGLSATPIVNDTRTVLGTLDADTFTLDSDFNRTVLSGDGNIDFGSGARDLLDLSSISSSTVTFNYASATGGVLYNPGNGTRVFDSITLNNGSQILFEGIDSIRFADGTVELSVTPNDPLFEQQWNLHAMGVQNAWRFTKGSTEVLVAVEDTGLGEDDNGYPHPDLRTTTIYPDNYRDDYFRNFSGSNYGPETSSHGTSVQGIIAAASNNGVGMSGINWNSPVFNIDVLDNNTGDQSPAEATQNMIAQASSQGQRLVINMSLGGGGIDPAFEQVIAKNQNNALFVISSGNDNESSIINPASLAQLYNNVIAVGASWGTHDNYGNATTPGDRISYPGWWGSNYGDGLTLMGPSEVIATSATQTLFGGVQFGYEDKFNGTSAAAPNVTGVASLVWSANPNLTAEDIKTILSKTAYDLGAPGYSTVYGYGFVNADAAVRRAMAQARGVA